jgi:glycosyltransferase involved in cell wall biosynthesis
MQSKIYNSKKPIISVVIATYNSRRTIEKCLQSIAAQTYPSIDLIVVDSPYYDAYEKKKCKKIIAKYARYYEDGPERSIQRNRGIKEAKGEYIMVIDQDMYLSKTVVNDCYNSIQQKSCVAVVIPEISIGEGFWTQCVALERYVSNYLEHGLNEASRFFRKKDAILIGGYDPELVGAEDSDFHYKMAAIGKIKRIKSVIYHDEGVTRFFSRVKKKYYYSKAYKTYIKKRPLIATAQLFPFKPAYIKHWKHLIRKPHLTVGMLVLRGAEVFAGALGLIKNR